MGVQIGAREPDLFDLGRPDLLLEVSGLKPETGRDGTCSIPRPASGLFSDSRSQMWQEASSLPYGRLNCSPRRSTCTRTAGARRLSRRHAPAGGL
jgi:hypothetical protein